METVIVNARLGASTKHAADRVLAANHRTWSQVIQSLAAYMNRTNSIPDSLTGTDEAALRERQRAREFLLAASGIVDAPGLATDSDTDQALFDALMERYG